MKDSARDVESAARTRALESRVTRLQVTLRRMEVQRRENARTRRRQNLIIGIGISLIVHLAIMYYLSAHFRLTPGGGPAPTTVSYEFAILQDEQLTELEQADLDDQLPEIVSETDDLAEEAAELDPAISTTQLEVARSGGLPTLGGAGSGTGDGGALAGGGAGTSFFGLSSRGVRFAFIVDRSGSMSEGRRMAIAMRELARSIEELPDYAYFHVVLYSTEPLLPPMQDGWMRARGSNLDRFIRWANRWLDQEGPTGGTEPMPAFYEVFALDVRPDVIFFLTDGVIPESTVTLVADANQRGGRVVINTVLFGEIRSPEMQKSEELLRRIASDSGGSFTAVDTGGW